MPEGDTVWRAARRLHEALSTHPLLRSDLRVPRLATADLTGRTVLETVSRGKHLLTRLEGGLTLHSHLGMDGAWRIYPTPPPLRSGARRHTVEPAAKLPGPTHEIRAVLATTERTAVGYRLPVLELLRTTDESKAVGHLGPDLLGPDWDAAEALRRLLATPDRHLGEALLDQRNLAGIGNIYKSELCFMLRASPWLPVGELTDPERAPALAKKLLEINKNRPARTTTPSARPDRRLWVYGRAGRPCLRCGTTLRTAEQGRAGQERATYWCPRCQRPDTAPETGN